MLPVGPTKALVRRGKARLEILTAGVERVQLVSVSQITRGELGGQSLASAHGFCPREVESGLLRGGPAGVLERGRQPGFERLRGRRRLRPLIVSPLLRRVERGARVGERGRVLVLEPTTGIGSRDHAGVQLVAGGLERLERHAVRAIGLDVAGGLLCGRSPVGGGLLLHEPAGSVPVGQLLHQRRALGTGCSFETPQRDQGVGQLTLQRVGRARRLRQPRFGLLLHFPDAGGGVGPDRGMQVVGEQENALGLRQLVREGLGLRRLVLDARRVSRILHGPGLGLAAVTHGLDVRQPLFQRRPNGMLLFHRRVPCRLASAQL